MRTQPEPTEYLAPSECQHPPPLRRLPTGEYACDRCCHVAMRADGSAPTYTPSAGHAKTAYAAPGSPQEATTPAGDTEGAGALPESLLDGL